MILEYSRIDQEIEVPSGCAIGAGYTTCMDINFRAIDMLQALHREYKELLKISGGTLIPQVHEKISDLREFTETFLYYFSQGANAERVSVSKDSLTFCRIPRIYFSCFSLSWRMYPTEMSWAATLASSLKGPKRNNAECSLRRRQVTLTSRPSQWTIALITCFGPFFLRCQMVKRRISTCTWFSSTMRGM